MRSLPATSLFVLALFFCPGCGGDDVPDPGTSAPVTPPEDSASTPVTDGGMSVTAKPDKPASKPKPKKPTLDVPEEFRFKSEPEILLTEDELRAGWIQLYDGQTLFGWQANNDVDWHVNDKGEIEASEGEPGLLNTTVPFADYELRCDYWMAEGGNSGIFLRTLASPSDPTKQCYELNICDSHPKFKTGSLVGRTPPSKVATGEEVWKTFHVRVEGNRIIARLDGELILDFEDETDGLRTSGFIGLQKNEGLIRFRNVFAKPLGAEAISNGKDLASWNVVAGSKSQFTADNGEINVGGGPGFLETKKSWADFVLQFEARTNDAGLNGGVFFRLIPGTEEAPSNGYELQIEHVFLDGDRTKAKDKAGTGAIFRRSQARWVIPNDQEMFYTTLVAYGPQFSSWVNGIQMTDWQDTRKADENPRRGSKVAAGPMSLQGHDDTTDISFGYFRVAPYPDGPAAAVQSPLEAD